MSTLTVKPVSSNGTTRYIPKGTMSGSVTNAAATTTVAPGDVTMSTYAASVSGKTRIDITPTTATTGISTYFLAYKANAAANTTGTTSSISGTGSATIGTAGYMPSGTSCSITASGTATAKTSSKDSAIYYLPMPSGSVTPEIVYNPNVIDTSSSNTSGLGIYASCTKTTGYITEGTVDEASVSYITGVTIPTTKSFSITTAPNTGNPDTSVLTVVNNEGRNVSLSNQTGSTTVTNNGMLVVNDASITQYHSTTSTAGNLFVDAYDASGNPETGSPIVVNGKWSTTNVSAAGTYYGKVVIGSGSASNSIQNYNMTASTSDNQSGVYYKIALTKQPGYISFNLSNTTYYINSITLPKNKKFSITTTANNELDDTPDLTITNNAYRQIDVTNNANGSVLITNTGRTDVISANSLLGNLYVRAYLSDSALDINRQIVSAGKWVTPSVSSAGTYYGRVTVDAGDYTASVSSHSISTTPVVTGSISGTGTNIATTSLPSGTEGTDYWTFTPGGSVTTTGVSSATGNAVIGTAGYLAAGNVESSAHTIDITPEVNAGNSLYLSKSDISSDINYSNCSISTTNASGVMILSKYTATAGYTKSKTVISSTPHFVNSVTIDSGKSFSVTCAGTTTVSANSSTTGTIKVSAYNSSGTLESNKTVAQSGKWKQTNVSAAGTYYGRVTISSGSVSCNAPSGSRVTLSSSNTSGIYVYSSAESTAGYIDMQMYSSALKYITGVSLPKGKSFSITVYTDASTQTTFVFTTDANGNTTVAEQ